MANNVMTNLNTIMKTSGFTGGVVFSPLSLLVDVFYRNLRKDKAKASHELKITNRRDTEANYKVSTRMTSDMETIHSFEETHLPTEIVTPNSGTDFIMIPAPENEALIENSIKATRLPDDLLKILDAKDKTLDRTLDGNLNGALSLSEAMSSLRDNKNTVSHNNSNRNVYIDSTNFLTVGN